MKVNINESEYKVCSHASKNMWCSKKPGNYGAGLLNSGLDKYKTERIGLLGEMAFSKIINIPYDFKYKEFGGDYDFIFNKKTIDIKTSRFNYHRMLIYAINEWGKKIELKSDIYVAAYLFMEDVNKNIAIVDFVGWIEKDNIFKDSSLVKSSRGNHINYEINYSLLNPMEKLLKPVN